MLDEPRLLAAHPWVTRRPITVSEYHRMGEVGILGDRDRVELIEGELVAMSPIGSYHHGTVNKLNHSLVQAVGERAVVSVQGLDPEFLEWRDGRRARASRRGRSSGSCRPLRSTAGHWQAPRGRPGKSPAADR